MTPLSSPNSSHLEAQCTYVHTYKAFVVTQSSPMALQLYSSAAPRASMLQNSVSGGLIAGRKPAIVCIGTDYRPANVRRKERRLSARFRVRSSLDAAEAVAVVGQVTEVSKDTFWPIVNAAGTKVVVLDMYTQWCGPCKVIAPKFQQLSEKYDDVLFLKLDCNQDNKPLAKELGIKVVPTFKILKDGKIVKEVTGAKIEDLVGAIEATRST
ncbi:thioredoxin F-type, chloroplastic-like [Andrographis paniculata]|uniref:thioredoxin F-type, chloroplastic-like n=1 Tax=Andrographis paniculata TaxID=175694 RepID=UPI0021E8ECFC|nr:thioredoxin F-type, chloroplastic-like [Andrographis paniculata]